MTIGLSRSDGVTGSFERLEEPIQVLRGIGKRPPNLLFALKPSIIRQMSLSAIFGVC